MVVYGCHKGKEEADRGWRLLNNTKLIGGDILWENKLGQKNKKNI